MGVAGEEGLAVVDGEAEVESEEIDGVKGEGSANSEHEEAPEAVDEIGFSSC